MKINFSINYKGYTADISYEPEDKIYVGAVSYTHLTLPTKLEV